MSTWHRKVLQDLSRGVVSSNSMDTYINLRFDGYVQWGGDGDIYLTSKGYEAVRGEGEHGD